jgi:hypothetical protein
MQMQGYTGKMFTKTSKHEKSMVTDCLSRLFYFNNELRLEHNTVERKRNIEHLSLLMKKIKEIVS